MTVKTSILLTSKCGDHASPHFSQCYSLVGNNRFPNLTLDPKRGIAELTPFPQDRIQFQPGDILGIYVEKALDDSDGVVVLTNGNFTSEMVWYGSITNPFAQTGSCPYPIGATGLLNRLILGAPVVSVSISEYTCPSANDPAGGQFTTNPNNRSRTFVNTALLAGVSASLGFIIIVLIVFIMILVVCQKIRTTNVHSSRQNALQRITMPADPYYSYPLNVEENIAYNNARRENNV